MKKRIIIFRTGLVITCLCFHFIVKAQQAVPINLATALKLGGANNLTIQEYEHRQTLALANLTKSKEWWLPDVYAGIQAHKLWGAVMNGNGNFFLDVNRGNLWTGLGLNVTWDFADALYNVKANRLQAQASAFKTQAQRNQSLLAVIDVYYDFLSAQLYYAAYHELALQADTISKQIEIQVKIGLRFESESLLSKSNLAHLKIEMLNARASYYRKSSELVRLLNLDANINLASTDTVMTLINLSVIEEKPRVSDSLYFRRPEMQSLLLESEALQTMRKTTTTGLLIPELRIGTYGSYFGGLNGPVTPMVPTDYPQTKMLYPTSELNAALLWRVPLGRIFYKGDLKRYDAQLNIQQTRLEQQKGIINEEVISAQSQLNIIREQMTIAREGSRLAEEALNQSMQRQQLGTVRPLEILQAQEIYIRSKLDELKAAGEFNKQQYKLFVAVGNNL